MKKIIIFCLSFIIPNAIIPAGPAIQWIFSSTQSENVPYNLMIAPNSSCWLHLFAIQAGESSDDLNFQKTAISMGKSLWNTQTTGDKITLTINNFILSQSDEIKKYGNINQFFQDYTPISYMPVILYFPLFLAQPGIGPNYLYTFAKQIYNSATNKLGTWMGVFDSPLMKKPNFGVLQNYAPKTDGPSF